jgi:hypothetical protein
MNKIAPLPTMLAIVLASFLSVTPASAAPLPLTWVSQTGLDTSDCTLAQPCRTFAGALAKTLAGGEIRVLSGGSFGPVTINQSISIIGDGVDSGILPPTLNPNNAIVIHAGAKDIINLRGLVLDGADVGLAGIRFETGAALHIQNCMIWRFQTAGIQFVPSGASELYVSDTLVANNINPGPGPGGDGISIRPSATGSAQVLLNRIQAEKNITGVTVDSSNNTGITRIAVRDSTVSKNVLQGIFAAASGSPDFIVAIHRTSVIQNGGTGIFANSARVWISNSTVSQNKIGLRSASGGVLDVSKNNSIGGNGADGEGPNIEEPPSTL